ncbi:MAG: hypothetical protein P4L92_11125 [Rudaea sp.]|nr:hypothetical protein [Rudaea sp.]
MKIRAVCGQRTCDAISRAGVALSGKIVRHHHEIFAGNDCSDALSEQNNPIRAEILSMADCYSHGHVMQIRRSNCGTKLDPVIFVFSRRSSLEANIVVE